ncbi:MAG: hypothetical protein WBF17_10925 [Phycisphaerae bacterium]
MRHSRREFLAGGASAVAAGVVGASVVGCKEEAAAPKTPPPMKAMVGACGLSCKVCPMMAAGKCKGCASGTEASAEMVEKKPCPVLKCAAMKKIDYCGTGCKMFTKCAKLIGKPYDKSFMEMMDKRMGAAT